MANEEKEMYVIETKKMMQLCTDEIITILKNAGINSNLDDFFTVELGGDLKHDDAHLIFMNENGKKLGELYEDLFNQGFRILLGLFRAIGKSHEK